MENSITSDCWISETYDRYAAIVFSILLDLCESETDAEAVLTRTFEKLYTENYFLQHKCIGLVNIIQFAVATARAQGSLKIDPCLKVFQQSPMLQQLLFNDVCLETICVTSGLTRLQIARQIRTELAQMNKESCSSERWEPDVYFGMRQS